MKACSYERLRLWAAVYKHCGRWRSSNIINSCISHLLSGTRSQNSPGNVCKLTGHRQINRWTLAQLARNAVHKFTWLLSPHFTRTVYFLDRDQRGRLVSSYHRRLGWCLINHDETWESRGHIYTPHRLHSNIWTYPEFHGLSNPLQASYLKH